MKKFEKMVEVLGEDRKKMGKRYKRYMGEKRNWVKVEFLEEVRCDLVLSNKIPEYKVPEVEYETRSVPRVERKEVLLVAQGDWRMEEKE